MNVQNAAQAVTSEKHSAFAGNTVRPKFKNQQEGDAGEWKISTQLSYDMDNSPPFTRGEKWFNGVTWWGVGWGANVGASLTMADELEHGRGQKFFNMTTDALARTPAFKWLDNVSQGAPRRWSRSMTTLGVLMMGGFAVMAPIKWAEDYKFQLVNHFDNWFGKSESKMTEDELKLKEARYEYLQQEPKQSWGTVLKGRIYTLIPVLALHYSAADKLNVINWAGKALGLESFKAAEGGFKGLNHHFEKTGEGIRAIVRKYAGVEDGAKLVTKDSVLRVEKRMDALPQKVFGELKEAIDSGKRTDIFEHGGVIWRKEACGVEITPKVADDYLKENIKLGRYFEPHNGASRFLGMLTNGMVDTFYSGAVATGTFMMAKGLANQREGVGKKAQKERAEIAKRAGVPLDEVPRQTRHAALVEVDGQPPSEVGRSSVPEKTVNSIEGYIASNHAQGIAAELGA